MFIKSISSNCMKNGCSRTRSRPTGSFRDPNLSMRFSRHISRGFTLQRVVYLYIMSFGTWSFVLFVFLLYLLPPHCSPKHRSLITTSCNHNERKTGNLISDMLFFVRLRLKCDGTREENRFRLSAKRTSPFKSAGASAQSVTGSRGVRISGSNAGYTMFRGSVKSTEYTLNSPVSPSLPLPCVTVSHHISTGLYLLFKKPRFKDIRC